MATSFLGQIRLMAAPIVPEGWAICNGQLLPISQNKALFSLLGTKYGGDGLVNFALPNLTNRVPVGVNHNDIKMGTVSAGNNAKLSPNAGYYILGTAIVGQIELFAGNFPPYGWAFCDGTLLNIPEYNTLFDILGTTHGGDGELTFALPNYTNQVAVGTGGGEANYQFGQTVGTRPIIVAKDPADRVKTVPTLGVSYIISLYGDSPS